MSTTQHYVPLRNADAGIGLRRAAVYVRMSTEHQKYSTENQADAIRAYAAQRGMHIVQTYADSGKSGLRIEGREALQRLIHDVENRKANFEVILVYDVSRWGRFQDADKSHIMSTSVAARKYRRSISLSNLKMMEALSRPSSRASSARWLGNTAASFQQKSLPASAG